jgi:opacity protein-like surface antigen
MEWNDKRDQRGDFGYTGGVGLEYKFLPNWAVQIEAVCYYSVVSATKQYMSHVKDYRYHTTLGLQAGVSYVF